MTQISLCKLILNHQGGSFELFLMQRGQKA